MNVIVNGSETGLKKIKTFEGARVSSVPQVRLEEVRKRARAFREEMLAGNQVEFFKTCTLVNVPYPMRYAFTGPFTQSMLQSPLIHITNRLFIIQFRQEGQLKTLLFSPSDVMANAETRFFKRFGGGMFQKIEGGVIAETAKSLAQKVVAPMKKTVEEWLTHLNISPAEVDYISYDHLHTQDLRNWLGSGKDTGYFPNAKLLVMRQEFESAQGLLPPQQDWYCPGGAEGIHGERVIQLDDDIMLGDGVAFVRTPGHTMGNHSLVVNTPGGMFVSSENGVCPEAYAPENSAINEIRDYARNTGVEVILNGNTQESGLEQYISMVQEKEIAGPSVENSDFPAMFCSSQFSGYWLFGPMSPTFTFEDKEYGRYVKTQK